MVECGAASFSRSIPRGLAHSEREAADAGKSGTSPSIINGVLLGLQSLAIRRTSKFLMPSYPPGRRNSFSLPASHTARAVFLDRDGVINRCVVRENKPYPPGSLAEFEFLPGVIEACRLLKEAHFLLVVITNQPDVGRGTQRQAVVEEIHRHVCKNLPIDRLEVCYDGGDAPSEFRKPAPGMVLRAARELEIDLEQSFLVGDRWRDVDCGVAAGCRTVFIDYGYREKLRAKPDFRVSNLLEAANLILSLSSKP